MKKAKLDERIPIILRVSEKELGLINHAAAELTRGNRQAFLHLATLEKARAILAQRPTTVRRAAR